MKKKYIRTVFFDKIKKKWISFYINKKGKIIIDKVTTYLNTIKKYLKNNRYKKINKKDSFGYKTILNEKKLQTKIDRLLYKKKLSDIDKDILRNYGETYNYRNIDIKNKLNIKESYNLDNTLIYFFDCVICKITSSYFKTYNKQFKLFQELFLRKNMNRFKSFLITIEVNGMELQGITRNKFFSSLKSFTKTMNKILDENFVYESYDWIRTRAKIVFRGIR